MAREDQDDVLRELLETRAWGIVVERVKEHAKTLRGSIFNESLPADTRLGKARELHGLRAFFDGMYRQVGDEMPADFRNAFE